MAATVITVYQAQGFGARFWGWHRFPYPQHMLYFERCQAVHSFGLTQPLAVRFIGVNNTAIGPWHYLAPNRILFNRKAKAVLEMRWGSKVKRHQAWVAFSCAPSPFKRWVL
ncbi:MAG TPA: hypothetical protein K8U84_09615 [Paenalcaligenes hominis]|uniref:Uncharacterized protein n=1 Tax=Paenalcaligenes hominis TaxID=643674 RepID=A0A9D3AB21_9BURK|nr:hypothetical protein [Paenalcaligenes hominis]NJB64381.1 hypothetical protein [Paenalcaligenes hominis]HJH24798.1 hypothetical protein [Paenalcaligenes hominis]